MKIKISVILPCRNEEKTVGICIKKIKEILKGKNYEIIVSDSSSDKSAEIAKKLGAKVVKHDKEGYGNACIEGAEKASGEILIFGDADNTYDFMEIPKLLEYVGEYDLILGQRKFIEKNAMPFSHRYIGNPVLSFVSRLFFHTKIHDINTGFRAIKKETFDRLGLQTTGMEFASEMIIQSAKKKIKIKEVPIHYYRREGDSKLRTFRDGWRHLRFILLYSPLFLFFIPGIFLFLLATIFLFYNVLFSALFIIVGYQLVIFALFAKTYAITHLGDKPIFEPFYKIFSIESASIIGLFAILLGVIIYFLIGANKTESAIVAFTFVVVGIQTIFSSFMLSILGIKNKENF